MPILRIVSACFLLQFCACSEPIGEVYIQGVDLAPLEVDCVADDTNGDGVITGFVAEEVRVVLVHRVNGFDDPAAIAPVTITGYRITYATAAGPLEMPFYDTSATALINAGETVAMPIRAVSFRQKTWCGQEYGNGYQDAEGRIVFRGYRGNNEDDTVEVIGSFDILLGNLVEP